MMSWKNFDNKTILSPINVTSLKNIKTQPINKATPQIEKKDPQSIILDDEYQSDIPLSIPSKRRLMFMKIQNQEIGTQPIPEQNNEKKNQNQSKRNLQRNKEFLRIKRKQSIRFDIQKQINFITISRAIKKFKQNSPYQQNLLQYQKNTIADQASDFQGEIELEVNENQNQQKQMFFNFYQKNTTNFERKINKCLNWLQVVTINPENEIILYWSIIKMIFIIYLLLHATITFTFELPFSKNLFGTQDEQFNSSWLYLSIFVFFLDIIFSMKTGYYVNGETIANGKTIIERYLKEQLIYDIISLSVLIVNLDLFSFLISGHFNYLKYINLTQVVKYKQFCVAERRISAEFQLNFTRQIIYRFLVVIFQVIIYAHIIGCLWYSVGNINNNMNWIDTMNLQDKSWSVKYLHSVYWAVATMSTVGYGDITPINNYEVGFVIISMLSSSVIFAYSLNTIGSIISEITKTQSQISYKLAILNNSYMKNKKISKSLQYRVRNYLINKWELHNQFKTEEENEILSGLTQPLQKQLQIDIYQRFLIKIPALERQLIINNSQLLQRYFSEKFITQLLNEIQEIRVPQNHTILNQNDIEHKNLYFVVEGQVVKQLKLNRRKINLGTIDSGEVFGQISFFFNDQSPFSVIAKTSVTLGILTYEKYLNLLQKFPEDYERHVMLSEQVKFQGTDMIVNFGLKCEGCKNEYHYLTKCPGFNFMVKKTNVIWKYLQSPNQERTNFDRKEQKFQTSLQLLPLVQETAQQFNEQNPSLLNIMQFQSESQLQEIWKQQSSKNSNNANNSLVHIQNKNFINEQHIQSKQNAEILDQEKQNHDRCENNDKEMLPYTINSPDKFNDTNMDFDRGEAFLEKSKYMLSPSEINVNQDERIRVSQRYKQNPYDHKNQKETIKFNFQEKFEKPLLWKLYFPNQNQDKVIRNYMLLQNKRMFRERKQIPKYSKIF